MGGSCDKIERLNIAAGSTCYFLLSLQHVLVNPTDFVQDTMCSLRREKFSVDSSGVSRHGTNKVPTLGAVWFVGKMVGLERRCNSVS